MSEYNGWTNWETWNCNLNFDGFFQEDAQKLFDDLDFSIVFDQGLEQLKSKFINQLSDIIQSTIEEFADEFIGKNINSFFSSLINNNISEINFWEIASHYWDDVDQTSLEEFKQEKKEEEEEEEEEEV